MACGRSKPAIYCSPCPKEHQTAGRMSRFLGNGGYSKLSYLVWYVAGFRIDSKIVVKTICAEKICARYGTVANDVASIDTTTGRSHAGWCVELRRVFATGSHLWFPVAVGRIRPGVACVV